MSTNDLYSRIVSERGSLERLVAKIPGFRGYMEKSARRQADRIIRDHIAGQLKVQLERVAAIEKIILDNGGLSYMSKTRSAKTKFQTYIDRIATDTPGYSGFFDAMKVGDEDLAVVYAFDQALLDYVEQLKAQLDSLEAAALANAGLDESIRALDTLTIEANQAYNLRDGVLNELN